MFTNPAGLFANKAEYIDGAKADTATYESVTNFDRVVNIYGDAAVVAGGTTVKGRYDGNEIGVRFRFTSTFVRRKARLEVCSDTIDEDHSAVGLCWQHDAFLVARGDHRALKS